MCYGLISAVRQSYGQMEKDLKKKTMFQHFREKQQHLFNCIHDFIIQYKRI